MAQVLTIEELERVAAAHWRGTEEERLGDWLLRAAAGFTGRANSALPLGDPGLPLPEAVDAVIAWYSARGLPPMIALPLPIDDADGTSDSPARELDRHLSERCWRTRSGPAFVMVADLPLGLPLDGLPAGSEFILSGEPDEAWLATYHYRGQTRQPPVSRRVLTSAREQFFASIRDGDTVLAIARLSIAGGWAGITSVEVHPEHRRRGLGAAITAGACRAAGLAGVPRVFLQVEVGNAPARALYERCGFRYSHRYHYRLAPAVG